MIDITINEQQIQLPNGSYVSLINKLSLILAKEEDPFKKNEVSSLLSQIGKIVDISCYFELDQKQFNSKFISYAKFPTIDSSNNVEIKFIGIKDGTHNKIDSDIKEKVSAVNLLINIQEKISSYIDDFIILSWNREAKIFSHPSNNSSKFIKHTPSSIEGESFLFALSVGYISNIFDLEIPANYFFSGSFDKNLTAKKVGNLNQKLKFISEEQPLNAKVFIPKGSDVDKFENIDIVEINSFDELIKSVFNQTIEEIVINNKERLRVFGEENSILEIIPKAKLKIELQKESNLTDNVIILSETVELNALHLKFSPSSHQVFPLPQKLTYILNKGFDLIALEGKVTTFYAGAIAGLNPQSKSMLAVKIGSDSNSKAIIFHTHPTKRKYLGYQFVFNKNFLLEN